MHISNNTTNSQVEQVSINISNHFMGMDIHLNKLLLWRVDNQDTHKELGLIVNQLLKDIHIIIYLVRVSQITINQQVTIHHKPSNRRPKDTSINLNNSSNKHRHFSHLQLNLVVSSHHLHHNQIMLFNHP